MADSPRPREAVRKMAGYMPPTGGRGGKLRLDFNENTVGCSPKVIEALHKTATTGFVTTYPEYEEARRKMGAFLGVDDAQVIFGDGTDEIISALLHAYVDPGDEVLMPWPTFSMFRFYSELLDAVPRRVPFALPDLRFPMEELLAAIGPRTKAICVASPNNPTGGAIRLEQVEQILEAAADRAVLIDEAYFEFHGVTALNLLPRYPNLFVSRTFSKAYGLAGLRVGCLISSIENIANVRKGQSPYSVGSIAIGCAMAAIDDSAYVEDYVKKVLEARALLCATLEELKIPVWPSDANFVLIDLGEQAEDIRQALRARDILIRSQAANIPGAMRVTVGTLDQTVRFLAALKEAIGR